MGQTLSEPITRKHTTSGKDKRIIWAASEMQGWRITMEDAHTTHLTLCDDKHISFFAVYDGHGGDNASKYCNQNLYVNVMETNDFKQGNYKPALKTGFLATDEKLLNDPSNLKEPSGCTAVTVLISEDNTIYCANAGDSRAVLSINGTAFPLSFDHKPTNQGELTFKPGEYNRILAAGGFVEFGRVNGNLALSRAIGDFEFKKNTNLPPEDQIVTCDPDIIERKIESDDEFIVIACDGIWDCMTSQAVIDFVRTGIADDKSLETIAEEMCDNCLADDVMNGVGCDNMTVVICGLLGDKTVDEWKASIAANLIPGVKNTVEVVN